MSELQLPFYAMLFSLLLCFAYFLRKRINLIENRIYSIMLICSTIDCVLVVVLRALSIGNITPTIIRIATFLNKLDFIQLIIISSCLFLYMLLVTFPEIYTKSKYVFKLISILNLIGIIIMLFSGVEFISNSSSFSVRGGAINITYFLCLLYIISTIIVPLLNIKHLDKRHIPMLFVVVSCIFLFFVYKYNPYLIVISITITLVNYLMYFTIENPDVKMLLEMKKSKDKLDKSNYDKSMFLFDMSKMVKRSTENINKIAYDVLDNRDIDKDNSMREIINEVSMLNTMCNKMFNINEVEASKIKIYNKKYDVKLLIKTLVKSYNRDNLNLSIDSNIPDNLYGDAITLKECLIDGLELFVNSDNIILNINSVNKNDICRLIISIEGNGAIDIENNDLYKNIYNRIILMGGFIILENNKINIILDQKMVIDNDDSLEKYTNYLKKISILVVDENVSNQKLISKCLDDDNVELTFVSYGKECLNRIRNNEKYDLILMSDELNYMSYIETVKKLKLISGFNSILILMTRDNNVEYTDSYKKYGFDDYILKPISRNKLITLLEKYFK